MFKQSKVPVQANAEGHDNRSRAMMAQTTGHTVRGTRTPIVSVSGALPARWAMMTIITALIARDLEDKAFFFSCTSAYQ